MDLQLKGRNGLITGASQGLGFATGRRLAIEGCNLVINSRNESKLNEAAQRIQAEANTNVIGIPGDMTDPSFANNLVHKTEEVLGTIDLLVTNTEGLISST